MLNTPILGKIILVILWRIWNKYEQSKVYLILGLSYDYLFIIKKNPEIYGIFLMNRALIPKFYAILVSKKKKRA